MQMGKDVWKKHCPPTPPKDFSFLDFPTFYHLVIHIWVRVERHAKGRQYNWIKLATTKLWASDFFPFFFPVLEKDKGIWIDGKIWSWSNELEPPHNSPVSCDAEEEGCRGRVQRRRSVKRGKGDEETEGAEKREMEGAEAKERVWPRLTHTTRLQWKLWKQDHAGSSLKSHKVFFITRASGERQKS